jgi:hypothetical protein
MLIRRCLSTIDQSWFIIVLQDVLKTNHHAIDVSSVLQPSSTSLLHFLIITPPNISLIELRFDMGISLFLAIVGFARDSLHQRVIGKDRLRYVPIR